MTTERSAEIFYEGDEVVEFFVPADDTPAAESPRLASPAVLASLPTRVMPIAWTTPAQPLSIPAPAPDEAPSGKLILPPGVRSVPEPQSAPTAAAQSRTGIRTWAQTWPTPPAPAGLPTEPPSAVPVSGAPAAAAAEGSPISNPLPTVPAVGGPPPVPQQSTRAGDKNPLGTPITLGAGRTSYLPDDELDHDYRAEDDDDVEAATNSPQDLRFGTGDLSIGQAPAARHPIGAPGSWLPAEPQVPPLPATAPRTVAPQHRYRTGPRPHAPSARPSRPARATTSATTPAPARLTSDAVIKARPARPEEGWRRAVFELTGGRWNPGISESARARTEMLHRICCPIRGSHQISVISVKGGVGKTTIAAGLGLTLADTRGDRVLAVDANPDLGTLADRLTGVVDVTVQHLLDFLTDAPSISINDIEQFVSTAGRLQVLAGNQEPCNGAAFTTEEYEEAIAVLRQCYNLVITDSGTGLNHSALEGTLSTADSVVIVGEPTVDAASRASMTLDWLHGSGYAHLARNAVVVLSQDRGSRDIDHTVIREHFAPPRCRAVVEVPADPHLATGGRITLSECRPGTRDAFLELAATLSDAFAVPPQRPASPEPHRRDQDQGSHDADTDR